MTEPYDLTKLDPNSFEHMVNYLALKVLGSGITGFAPGADGGRDGYLIGEAAYPTQTDRWSGTWFIQSKFHKPHLSNNPQVWLKSEVQKEIKKFTEDDSKRKIPNNWIIATNIDPSGQPETGSYDSIRKLVHEQLGESIKFDIWGGRKILNFLLKDPKVATAYGHFLTPGNILTAIYENINDSTANIQQIIQYLVVNQFNEQIYTKLEQAGSASDSRPKIYQLFIDLPYARAKSEEYEFILNSLVSSAANTHKASVWGDFSENFIEWSRSINRARTITIKGGPGQGKSTIGQYFSQIQRAALILSNDGPSVIPAVRQVARELMNAATSKGFWPTTPRIPVNIELKDFARWYGSNEEKPKGILSYLADKISIKVEQEVLPGTLIRALSQKSWFINFDGLDEVPNDVKDKVAEEIITFTNELAPSIDADILTLCSTRPQGYSGQFDRLDGATISLSDLPRDIALDCASALLKFGRNSEESETAIQTLASAMESQQVLELMTTPLQSHIMAVVVRDGGRPPEKRWQLFENFYQVMKKRESTKGFQDVRISTLLRENDQLLKAIHARLGIALHARAENSKGAETTLDKAEFKELATQTTEMLIDDNVESMVDALMEATTERLVLVNTPENSQSVRFDIRQLQEFFAAEFIYSGVTPETLRERIEIICSDEHWREVMHFLLSALIVCARTTEVTVAIETLQNTDEGNECHNIKTFKRRIASGAILALRLLNEGVLEQDKRVRQKFSKILTPIFSTYDFSTNSTIVNIKHQNTLTWLVNCMIDHISTSNETECIGAAIALSEIMITENPRAEETFKRIFNFSDRFINSIIETKSNEASFAFSDNEKRLSHHFMKQCVMLLLEEGTTTRIKTEQLITIIRANQRVLDGVIKELALTPYEKGLLEILTSAEELFKSNETEEFNPDASDNQSYAGIKIRYHKYNWLTNSHQPFLIKHEETKTQYPILKISSSILKFIQERNYESFITLTKLLAEHPNTIELFPRHITALIPLTAHPTYEINTSIKLSNITKNEFNELLSTGKYNDHNLFPTPSFINTTENISEISWSKLCKDIPAFAVRFWFYPFGPYEIFHTDEASKYSSSIAQIALERPDLISGKILTIEKIFKYHPELEQKIKELLSNTPINTDEDIHTEVTRPFNLEIDKYPKLLLIFAHSITTSHPANTVRRRNHIIWNEKNVYQLEDFNLSVHKLQNIYTNKNEASDIRAAALVCRIMMHESDFTKECFFTEGLDKLTLTINSDNFQKPMATAITKIFKASSHAITEKEEAYLGEYISSIKNNYQALHSIQPLIYKFREQSKAPIQTNNVLSKWLAEESLG